MKKIAIVLFCLFCLFEVKSQDLEKQGLVDVLTLDSTIVVTLVYATKDNFTGQVLYRDLKRAYLHPDAARALVKAQSYLKEKNPNLSLVVYDAARPMSVQKIMWDKVKATPMKNYVSNPANGGGMHNYGVAVDLSIIDLATGLPLPMGTDFDHLGPESGIASEQQLLKQGKITRQQLDNRLLLRRVMTQAGFTPLSSEWWHFNLCSRAEARVWYKVIE